ncbi:MAG: gamma carbonic anhydrase family protein [Candidatus Thiodiazotropha sp. (ex Gloverina cf. vestifex)]|nr:gamma carbonic anhydrase family protein [Candidatus Thiodiazotropha sp. (ex Gloverina cf. vestifex)]
MPNIRRFETHTPAIAQDAWIDETAVVIGDVSIASQASIWPMCVLRGDVHHIEIGERSNIQDGSILHVSHDSHYLPGGRPLTIGDGVTVGHRVMLHGCAIADGCFIGMGSTILDGARLDSETMLGAGSLVPQGRTLEGGYLWLGRPARRVRALREALNESFVSERFLSLASKLP